VDHEANSLIVATTIIDLPSKSFNFFANFAIFTPTFKVESFARSP
jgi:hypothetical protein